MDVSTILELVKAKLGLSGTARNTYLTAIIDGVLKELEDEKGLVLDGTNPYHLIFVVDYVTWRYQNRDSDKGMPRHLKFRLNNLMIHVGNDNLIVNAVLIVEALPVTPVANTVYIISDGTKQMYINDVWATVDLIDGSWVVIAV